jgi:hypothetical protein
MISGRVNHSVVTGTAPLIKRDPVRDRYRRSRAGGPRKSDRLAVLRVFRLAAPLL